MLCLATSASVKCVSSDQSAWPCLCLLCLYSGGVAAEEAADSGRQRGADSGVGEEPGQEAAERGADGDLRGERSAQRAGRRRGRAGRRHGRRSTDCVARRRQRGSRHHSLDTRPPGGRRGSGDCRDAADATQEQEAEEKGKKLSFAYDASALRACARGDRKNSKNSYSKKFIFRNKNQRREREQVADAEILSGS